MATTTREIIHVRRLLADFGVFLMHPTPRTYDSQSAIKISTNPVIHERTKHIEIDCYITRQHFTSGTISLLYVGPKAFHPSFDDDQLMKL